MEIFKWSLGDVSCRLFGWKECSRISVSPTIWFRLQPSNSILSVESSPNVGNTFTNACKDWREGTYDNFKDWVVKQFGFEDLESDDEGEVPVDEQKAKDLKFERNENGDFILPEKYHFKNIKQKQRIIRGYIGAVYSECV